MDPEKLKEILKKTLDNTKIHVRIGSDFKGEPKKKTDDPKIIGYINGKPIKVSIQINTDNEE